MDRKEVHNILDEILDEGEGKKLYGQTSFTVHWQDGKVRQITDETIKRTWIGPSGSDGERLPMKRIGKKDKKNAD